MTHTLLQRNIERPPATSSAAPADRLRIGATDDAAEHEAERVANGVTSGSAARPAWSASRFTIQPAVQRKAAAPASGGGYASRVVQEVLNSPGSPLDSVSSVQLGAAITF